MDPYARMTQVIEHILEHRLEHQPLAVVAASLGVSAGHLQKLFTAWVGISPKQFGRYLSLTYAKELLAEDRKSLETAIAANLSSGSRLHDLFVDIEAMTPGEYADGGRNLEIRYACFPTRFGSCLVAATDRGITNILFDVDEGALRALWPNATLKKRSDPAHEPVKEYFATLSPRTRIKLHLKGTNFQIKVWEALLSIPEGSVTSYGGVAARIKESKKARAVGRAIGDNPIAYLIPCHRVLKGTGAISGYRWGIARKRLMLAAEALRKEM
ncbi:MAG TPA: methylated-DNA--[protein]-cysteine S-methyltransferase [Candidatus Paceibacterota bacterium]